MIISIILFYTETNCIVYNIWYNLYSIGISYPSKFIAEMIMYKVKSGEQEGQIIKWLGTRKLLNGFSLPSLKHGNSSSFETNAVKTIKIYTYVCAMFTVFCSFVYGNYVVDQIMY